MVVDGARWDRFLALPPDAARELALEWAAIPSWASALAAARPYGSVEELSRAARDAAEAWTWPEVMAALAEHPRIGQRAAETSRGASSSVVEQAASAGPDPDTAAAIRAGNVAYEDRFGWVFLIRAAGRSAPEILLELQRRSQNGVADEQVEVRAALRDIALLRIDRAFGR
ncbi:2-oxo-4-hydroxy-4-carboxy-5-ureidoimidazoline decarboxylase [Clavibacter nebraskensis]|uniref:2-oxo-4-hydroxy-4-carboxy-5-ureidoimidazoline decarboxylase n=2 Tax=Clavibacter nebraskensis TaxID=31963 RepID=A0A399Q7W7_9MICO|nr:2-oxo-4-hydroxy-4-carboxy-5-ureidoimidazoline decarboxylase [Clavibacter nebraskensis]CCE74238.1 2-oxo-4-hydroxy-4-carboxy-5-ureidoimidazolinedecarboxylase [Clavibacter nebraskensis NCPPB 2581]QGV70779.1 2-oxo-4-hydroxy-4-carboxy-5-ureidoimidazoline decarboxylase [Clavibacter nebraskensis]QGV73571.1 2-oxo-4-hydroxy-4-carboxy-5-ureidoimidazoline decarboxylase [Clavibacter nebraskensis]RIJ14591.1 2-oxo-4-hydroxy-4-carboxy-5-ureidoimidazoline decarboxylase [Clavibacter nebraskensis]